MRLSHAAFLLALLPGAAAAAEAPRSFSLTYDLWQGGFHAMILETQIKRSASGYRAAFEARTNGVVGMLYAYTIEAQSSGLAGDPLPTPKIFRTEKVKRGETRRREIVYGTDGSLAVRHDPPKKIKKRERVPRALQVGTLDPVSAVYSVIEIFEREGRCAGDVPVFDGRRRYNFKISQVGQVNLAPSEYSIYSGPASLCRVTVERLAGFKKKKSPRHLPIALDVWLAPVIRGGPALPVRMEGSNSLGHMVIHLAGARNDSPTKHAAR